VEGSRDEQLWYEGGRAAAALAFTAGLVALAACLRRRPFLRVEYFWQNRLPHEASRGALVASVFVVAGLAFAAGVAYLLARRKDPDAAARLGFLAARAAPVGPLALFSCLFDWQLYVDHDLTFLVLVLLVALALGATVGAAVRAGPSAFERRLWERLRVPLEGGAPGGRLDRACVVVVGLAIAAFVLFFSWSTVIWHRSVRSGYDLAIEDNIMWNLLRGRFFHAAPTLGPTGSHFGRHATLISYLLLPFYALHQSAETLHVLQSTLVGLAALPLFLFARRRVGSVAAAVVAVAYLLHPAVQQGDLFEMHYVKLGPVFFFTALWLLDAGRIGPGLAAAALTLLVREDVATWVVLLGVFLLFSSQTRVPRKTALGITVVSAVYVVTMKFVAMPSALRGGDELLFMYSGLVPAGRESFAWVLATVFGNPAFTVQSLLEPGKLMFLLMTLVPLAFIPLRRSIGFFALIPGILYCFLATNYPALLDIHFQYSPHVLAFEFPAAVLVLGAIAAGRARAPLVAALVALGAATLACSYQYGAVFQQHTSRGGPLPFKFGWDDEGRERYRAIEQLKQVVPPNARVAASAFTVTQLSARQNDYSLSLSVYDADWIVAPTNPSEFVATELPRTEEELSAGRFGVVAVEGPFFAARRGASTERNAEMLSRLARR
jgi:uncharacterized membrane protein